MCPIPLTHILLGPLLPWWSTCRDTLDLPLNAQCPQTSPELFLQDLVKRDQGPLHGSVGYVGHQRLSQPLPFRRGEKTMKSEGSDLDLCPSIRQHKERDWHLSRQRNGVYRWSVSDGWTPDANTGFLGKQMVGSEPD